MRTVTMQEFQALKSALADLGRTTHDMALLGISTDAVVHAMAQDGKAHAAGTYGAQKLAELQLAFSACSAKYQQAVQAFLGEVRRPSESMDEYAARIGVVLNDLPAMLAMQQRNGLVFRF